MFSYIRKYRFAKAMQSHANYGRHLELSGINTGASIGLLSRWEHRADVRRLAATAASSIQDVQILYYHDQEVDVELEPQENSYSKKTLKYGVVPSGVVVDQFINKVYDRLFFVDTELDMHQRFICELATTRLSIGPLLLNADYQFDFSIDVLEQPVSYFVDEVIRALDLLSR